MVGAKFACIEGPPHQVLQGIHHNTTCHSVGFFFAPNKDLHSLAPTTSLKKNNNV